MDTSDNTTTSVAPLLSATKVQGVPSLKRLPKLLKGVLPVSLRAYIVSDKGTFKAPPFARFQAYDNAVVVTLPPLVNDVDLEIQSIHVVEVANNYVVRALPLEDGNVPAGREFVLGITVPMCEVAQKPKQTKREKSLARMKKAAKQDRQKKVKKLKPVPIARKPLTVRKVI